MTKRLKRQFERQRRCLSCGEIGSGAQMLRFVVIKGRVVFDPQARVQQRGIWLSPRVECIMRACTKNMFKRAFRGRVNQKVIEALPLLDEIKQALYRAFMQKLVIAVRHGIVRLLEKEDYPAHGSGARNLRSGEVIFKPIFALEPASLGFMCEGKQEAILPSADAIEFIVQPTRLGRSFLQDGMRLNSL